ncbi:MAG: cation transporter [Actinomycetota bacterium]
MLNLSSPSRPNRLRRGLRLEYFTLVWNAIEAIVGMVAGIVSGSVSLVAFALDSVVEASSGAVLMSRLKAEQKGKHADDLERRAIRQLAWAFFALAAYVGFRAVQALVTQSRPEDSPVGIGLAIVSLTIMPVLARKKRKVAAELDSRALQADSTQTDLCTYLSAILLVGLLANSLLGWWWADPIAGLGIAFIAAKEGRELWVEEGICCK